MEHQLAVRGHPAATPHFMGDGVRARDFPTTTGMKQQTEPKMFEGASDDPPISVAVRALPSSRPRARRHLATPPLPHHRSTD